MSSDSITRQWQDGEPDEYSSKSYALSGRIMLASIIILFVIVVLLVVLHLYARWYLLRLTITRRRNRRNRHIIFYVDNNRVVTGPTGGLHSSVLNSLPVFVYKKDTNMNMPECAVCLSEFEEGETGRVLPKCKHSFHTECIDMWFGSNSTCPLCRSPVEEFVTEPGSRVSPNSPVHHLVQPVQFVDDNNEVGRTGTTSFTDRRKGIEVRIDVPNRSELTADTELQMTSPSQGFRSPGSRLRSLKRIISMGRKSPSTGVGPSCGPVVNDSDLESARQESVQESSRLGTLW